MNKNIETIIAACKELGVSYDVHHSTGNLISLILNGKKVFFINWTTPMNPHSIVQLCQDKDYFYSYLSDVIKMPKTLSFLTPYCEEKYEQYLEEKTISEIIKKTESKLNYPVIVKKNKGSLGSNVFKTNNRKGLEKGLIDIYNVNSSEFDYVAIVQEYIDIKEEYRSIFINGEHIFSYRKAIEQATFSGNLSRLHWDGAFADLVTDDLTIKKIENFCNPMFKKLNIPYCGLDIAIDTKDKLFLIEANSSPGFNYILDHNGEKQVKNMYKLIIKELSKNEVNE